MPPGPARCTGVGGPMIQSWGARASLHATALPSAVEPDVNTTNARPGRAIAGPPARRTPVASMIAAGCRRAIDRAASSPSPGSIIAGTAPASAAAQIARTASIPRDNPIATTSPAPTASSFGALATSSP